MGINPDLLIALRCWSLASLDPGALARSGLLAPRTARGLVASFDTFARPGLDTARVDPAVRAFYERSSELALEVRPSWQGALGASYRVLRPVLRRLGQLDFPTGSTFVGVDGELSALDVPGLGEDTVAWRRRWRDASSRTMYGAVHATHRSRQRTCMDFALPLLGGVLVVTLRLDALDVGMGTTALTLTSFAGHADDEAGTWFVRRGLLLPVPIRERITVWAAGMPGAPAVCRAHSGAAPATAYAQHHFFLCGVRFLTLHYRITSPHLLP